MLATIAILESIFTISYNISDKKCFKIQDYRFIKDFIKDNIYDKPEKHLFLEKSTHKEIKFMNQIGG